MTLAVRRALLAVLLPALLLAQTLGLLHASLHGGGTGVQSAAIAQAAQAAQVQVAKTWVADLFAAHDAGSCRLYDQLTHGDAAAPAAPAVAVLQVCAVAPLLLLPAVALAAPAAFEARGPPALR